MIRSTYRNVMMGLLVVTLGVSFYLFRMTQDKQVEISDRQNDITRLNQELENAQTLNVALTELDSLTITEQTATQLDILRHLGLERSELQFELESRDVQSIGSTSLYVHNVKIIGTMPYETALGLCDRLQNTKKIMLDGIDITASTNSDSSDINLMISGKIYGLDKALPQNNLPIAEIAPTSETSATTPVSPTVINVSTTTAISASIAVSVSTQVTVTLPLAVSPITSVSETDQ